MMNSFGNIMMSDQIRNKMESNYSPKSSPHGGGRSPVVARQDSSGTLKTTISLGKTPTIIHTGPFYSMKEPPGKGELTGDKDLMTEYGLHHTLTKFKDKKVKESLSSFLPNLPGIYDGQTNLENSTLRSVIEKPPIGGKELQPLTSVQLAGFRLHPGPLPEQYRTTYATPARKHKNKHKKHKHKDGTTPPETSLIDPAGTEPYEKKHKKQKRHEDDKERKKRKKEKKRKKKNQSPEPSAMLGSGAGGGSGSLTGVGSLLGSSGISGGLSGLSSTVGAGMGVLNTMPAMQMQMQQQQLQQMSSSNSASLLQQQQQQQQQQQMIHSGSGGPGSTLLGSVMGASGGAGSILSQQTPLF